MSVVTENRAIQAELDRLVTLQLVTPAQRARLGERYPTGPVDLGALARWFTILGAVAAAAGVALLVHDFAGLWLALEGGLVLLGAGLLAGGWTLRHRRGFPATGAVTELLGVFALEGLVVTLALHHSTGSDDWPALVGVLTVLAAAAAYALRNRLVLVLAGVLAFSWFGGSTGYASGWGAYWLGMTYPARFLVGGLAFLAVAWIHARGVPPAWQGFSRVYAHLGMLDLHLALWFLAVFGWFTDVGWSRGGDAERLVFSALWAAVAGGSIYAASRTGLRLLRSYGLVFLLIDVYTFYFQFVVWHSAEVWYLHLLVAGAGLVGGGMFLERHLKGGKPVTAE